MLRLKEEVLVEDVEVEGDMVAGRPLGKTSEQHICWHSHRSSVRVKCRVRLARQRSWKHHARLASGEVSTRSCQTVERRIL